MWNTVPQQFCDSQKHVVETEKLSITFYCISRSFVAMSCWETGSGYERYNDRERIPALKVFGLIFARLSIRTKILTSARIAQFQKFEQSFHQVPTMPRPSKIHRQLWTHYAPVGDPEKIQYDRTELVQIVLMNGLSQLSSDLESFTRLTLGLIA